MKFDDLTRNQVLGFFLGLVSAVIGWYYLLLMTQKEVAINTEQLIGLGFGVMLSILSWSRFVFVTAGSFKKPA